MSGPHLDLRSDKAVQPQLLLPFPKNRLRLLKEITSYQQWYEREQLRLLQAHDPQDERVSQEQIWQERKVQVAREVQQIE